MLKEDAEFAKLYMKGTEYVLKNVCGFDKSRKSRDFQGSRINRLPLKAHVS